MKATEYIKAQVVTDEYIEVLFQTVCGEFDLKHGDITPLQSLKLSNIQEDLVDLLTEFVEQNKEEEQNEENVQI